MSKHTPGPWVAWDTGNGMGICPESAKEALFPSVAAFQSEICRVKYDDAHWEEHKANARLIAAAPEMLEIAKAYRNLLKTMAHTEGEIATYQHIEAVIAKAAGRS